MNNLYYIHLTELGFMTEGPFKETGTDRKKSYDSYKIVKDQLLKDAEKIREKDQTLDIQKLGQIFSPFFSVKAGFEEIQHEAKNEQKKIEEEFKNAYIEFLRQSLSNDKSELFKYIGRTDNVSLQNLLDTVSSAPPNINSILTLTKKADLTLPDFKELGRILLQAEESSKEVLDDYLKKIAQGSNQTISYNTIVKKIKESLSQRKNVKEDDWLNKAIQAGIEEINKNRIKAGDNELDMNKAMALTRKKIAQAVNKMISDKAVQTDVIAFLKQGTESNVGGVLGEQFLSFLINKRNICIAGIVENVQEAIVTGQELAAIPLETKGQTFKGKVRGVEGALKDMDIPQNIRNALKNMETNWEVQIHPGEKETIMTTQIKPDIRFDKYNISVKNYDLSSKTPSLEETTIAKVLSYRDKVSQYIFMNVSAEKKKTLQKKDYSHQNYTRTREQIIDILGCWVIASALGGLRAGRPTANIFIAIDNSTNKLYIIDIRDTIERMLNEIGGNFKLETFLENIEGGGKQFLLGLRRGEKSALIKNTLGQDDEIRSQQVENAIWQKYMDTHIGIQLPKKYFMT